jgi:RNA polymerase sigma factor (sigma-70 family)
MSESVNITDETLVKGCIDNDAKSQRLLFERYSRRMMGICLRYAASKPEAEDMLQDGWIKVFRSLNSFRFEGSVEGWIKRVIVNTCLETLRKNKMQFSDVEIETVDEMGYLKINAGDALNAKELLKMVHQLPAGYRSVFNLFAIEGYSHKEISKMLTISEGTSKSQYSRARLHLQKMLEGEKKTVSQRFSLANRYQLETN